MNVSKLDNLIACWRKEVNASGKFDSDTIAELESHLREHVEALMHSGNDEATAFRVAVEHLGAGEPLGEEFAKLKEGRWWALTFVCSLAGLLLIALMSWVAVRVGTDKVSLLLGVHIFSVTAGFSAVLFSGTLGVCYLGQRYFHEMSTRRTQMVREAVFMFTLAGFVLTGVGIVLGSIWTKLEWGRYWSWDVKEVGALLAWMWCAIFLALQRSRIGGTSVMQWSAVGNLIFCVSLFGPAFWQVKSFNHPALFYACVLAGVHLGALAVSFLPSRNDACRRANKRELDCES